MNNPSATKRTAEDAAKAWMRAQCEHDLDAFVALLAPEFVGSGPYSAGERIGKEDYVKAFEGFHQAFSDLKMEPTSILSQGDAVAWEYVESATFKAPVVGPGGQTLAPTNRSYRVPVGAFLRINASGLIVELRVYDNPLLASQQLGMDPTVFLPTKAQDTVKAFIRAFNAHDVEALLAWLSPDFGGMGYHAQKWMGKEDYAKIFVVFGQAFPDFKWELTSIVGTSDTVAFEGFESATFTGPYVIPGHTFAPTNRPYRVPVAAFFHVNADGLITTYQLYGDIHEMFQQVGLDPQHIADWRHSAT